MDDRFNTTAGWVLFAGIIALGSSLLVGEYFRAHPVEKGGYAVADAEPTAGGGGAAAEPTNFAAGDAAKGETLFSKCASCHTITQGGANGIGPNLYGVMGQKYGHIAGFAYSAELMGMGNTWTFENMDAWLASPKKHISGTKMSFAGLSKPEDRADIIAYINAQGSNLPVPAAPAATAEAAAPAEGAATAEAAAGNAAAPAEAAAAPAAK